MTYALSTTTRENAEACAIFCASLNNFLLSANRDHSKFGYSKTLLDLTCQATSKAWKEELNTSEDLDDVSLHRVNEGMIKSIILTSKNMQGYFPKLFVMVTDLPNIHANLEQQVLHAPEYFKIIRDESEFQNLDFSDEEIRKIGCLNPSEAFIEIGGTGCTIIRFK